MATFTSTQTGDFATGSTWVGGTAPSADGDIVVIANTHTVTVSSTPGFYLGANTGTPGDAVTVNSGGTLVVSSGATLKLRGTGTTSNRAMLNNGTVTFAAGSGCQVDCASAYQTVIDNRGVLSAIGTSGSHITFTSPSGNVAWNNAVTGTSEAFSGASWKFDPGNNVACVVFTNKWIANAAGTGIGSLGDTSVSFTGTNASAFTTEVALGSRSNPAANVTSSGKYAIDYDLGVVYFYWTSASGNPSFNKVYQYLTVSKGWGIKSTQGASGNQAYFDYCDFSYMGDSASADTRVLDLQGHRTAGAAANRLAYVKNCTFTYCHKPIGLKDCKGTAGDPFLITGNTFNAAGGSSTFGGTITAYNNTLSAPSDYVSVSNNTGSARGVPFLMAAYTAAFSTPYPIDLTGWKFQNNTLTLSGAGAIDSTCLVIRWAGIDVSGNTMDGTGSAADMRCLPELGGTASAPALVHGNTFRRAMRAAHQCSHLWIYGNVMDRMLHHALTGCVQDNVYVTNYRAYNNVFIGELGSGSSGYDSPSPSIELGYNHTYWLDDVIVAGNTVQGPMWGGVSFGDMQDVGTYTLASRVRVVNNLVKRTSASTSRAWQRVTNTAGTSVFRGHISQFDYNLDHNVGTRYTNLNRQATFTGITNVTGVALYDPNYASASGKTLAYTHTSATDRKLSWDGGTAVQIVYDSGTVTAAANGTKNNTRGVYSGTLTDSGKAWNTSRGNASSPSVKYLLLTSGALSGTVKGITTNTATALTVVPGWTGGGISALTGAGTSPIQVTTSIAHGLSTGTTVVIAGVATNTAANGTWVITVTGATTFTLDGSTGGTGTPTFNNASWDAIPAVGDSYVILEPEVTLADSGGSNTVRAGIYAPSLPTSSQTDSAVSFSDHSVTGSDPLLVNAGSTTPTDYAITSSSPAKDVGVTVSEVTDDYSGTARPQGGAYDIGAFELLATSTGRGGRSGLSGLSAQVI